MAQAEKENKIVVYDSYDTVMAANLVKTKLDAYGIPCFLSNENFAGLYPVRNQLRLFIFEKDRERVEEVMADVTVSEPERLQCPHCGSTRVQPEEANSFPEKLIHSILSGLFLNPHNKLQCQDCHRTFEPGNEN